MKKREYSGIYGIVMTPFREDGSPDYTAIEQQSAVAAESPHISGLVVCGSTGEFTRLNFDENVELMRAVSRGNQGKKQLILGATAGDSYTACKYVEQIQRLDADGILVAPPFYFSLNREEILEYYNAVIAADEAKIPIIGYNIPQCTNAISNDVYKSLLHQSVLKGFKNSWNDLQQITEQIMLRDEERSDVSYFTGLDACLYGVSQLGGDGIFSAISYLLPDIIGSMFLSIHSGRSDYARRLQYGIINLVNIVNQFSFPFGYRVLAEAVGVELGKGREAIPAGIRSLAESAKEEMLDCIFSLREYIDVNK